MVRRLDPLRRHGQAAASRSLDMEIILAVNWTGIVILLVVVAMIVLVPISIYNRLVTARNRVKNAFSQIDVQLKRRYDLIPNLVETVKGYAAHERETLERVIQARQQAIGAQGVAQQAAAENFLSGALRQLFALSEAYPDLKANQNFGQLQEELTSTENKIGFARQHYNNVVENYNTKIQSFPAVLFAGMFGFQKEEYFELTDPAEREPVRVKF
jgi:LemA protein